MPRKSSQTVSRGASPQERAVLVGLHLTGRTAKQGRQAMLARQAALLAADGPAAGPHADADAQLFAPDDDFVEELAEFRELVTSAGAAIEAEIVQRRERPDAATLIGPGKVEEVAAIAASSEADLVIFGRDLSPSQLRNLEASLPCRVIDRTQLILDIFARHARTREGQLQVELAQLEYLLPRLAGRGKAMSQLGGGIGTRGPGETKLETDRRQIRKRIDHIKAQVEAVRRTRQQQRQRREAVPVPTVALVGYTNAGKSTLFNALTKLAGASAGQAEVLESARMFATLDPKLRAITLPSRRKVLLADTVGFVRDLPHTLITSFRATLEEAATAEVLLHVRDASSSTLDRQKEDVETVLAELEITGKPVIQVLNKSDLLLSPQESGALARREAGLAVSALKHTGLAELLEAVESAMQADPMQSCWLRVPQAEGGVLAALEAGAVVSQQSFEGNFVYLHANGPASLMGRFRKYQTAEPT